MGVTHSLGCQIITNLINPYVLLFMIEVHNNNSLATFYTATAAQTAPSLINTEGIV